jgi:hypothetical protein
MMKKFIIYYAKKDIIFENSGSFAIIKAESYRDAKEKFKYYIVSNKETFGNFIDYYFDIKEEDNYNFQEIQV